MDKKTSELIELLKEQVTDADLLMIVNAGESKKIKKSTLFSLISDAIDTKITAFKTAMGVISVQAATPIENILTLEFVKIAVANSTQFDKSNANFSYDFGTNQATIVAAGIYDMSIFAAFTAPNNTDITFATYVNNAFLNQIVLTGGGNTKSISLVGSVIAELPAGAVVDIRAKANADASLITIVSSQYKIEKTHFL